MEVLSTLYDFIYLLYKYMETLFCNMIISFTISNVLSNTVSILSTFIIRFIIPDT